MKNRFYIRPRLATKGLACCLLLASTACSQNVSPSFASASHGGMPMISKSAKWHVIKLLKAAHLRGIAVDARQNVYFTQKDSTGVKMLKTNGRVTNLGGGLKLPWGVAAYRSRAYVADSGNALVKRILRTGKVKALGSGWLYPFAVATDSEGNLYVLDPAAEKVTRIAPKGVVSSISTPESCGEGSGGLGVDSEENMYVSCVGSDQVFQIQPDGTASSICSHWNVPSALTTASDGDTFVANDEARSILECSASGQLDEIKTDSNIGRVVSIAVAGSGDLYVASQKFGIFQLVPPQSEPF